MANEKLAPAINSVINAILNGGSLAGLTTTLATGFRWPKSIIYGVGGYGGITVAFFDIILQLMARKKIDKCADVTEFWNRFFDVIGTTSFYLQLLSFILQELGQRNIPGDYEVLVPSLVIPSALLAFLTNPKNRAMLQKGIYELTGNPDFADSDPNSNSDDRGKFKITTDCFFAGILWLALGRALALRFEQLLYPPMYHYPEFYNNPGLVAFRFTIAGMHAQAGIVAEISGRKAIVEPPARISTEISEEISEQEVAEPQVERTQHFRFFLPCNPATYLRSMFALALTAFIIETTSLSPYPHNIILGLGYSAVFSFAFLTFFCSKPTDTLSIAPAKETSSLLPQPHA